MPLYQNINYTMWCITVSDAGTQMAKKIGENFEKSPHPRGGAKKNRPCAHLRAKIDTR